MPGREITFEELGERLRTIAEVAGAQGTIGVRDPEVAWYAHVLEYGSIAGQPPWPRPGARTTLAVDPQSGSRVVVSVQAPQGFIRVRSAEFSSLIVKELGAAVDWLNAKAVGSHLVGAIQRSTVQAVEALRAAAPRESGRLAENIEVISD